MIKKSVGGKEISVVENTELITRESCGFSPTANVIRVSGFFIKNEDAKDIYVNINGGSDMLLRQGELFDIGKLTDVESCIVRTASKIRWGGLK